LGVRLFPVAPVERPRLDLQTGNVVESVEVQAPRRGVRARLIEALDPAGPAKEMVRGAGAEAVRDQLRLAGEESEFVMQYDQVAKACRRADRAIALEQLDPPRNFGLEADLFAMTAAFDLHGPPMQHCFPPVIRSDTRLLLLGSLPGAISLAEGRYYANPRNQFWRLAGAVIDRDLVAFVYEQRLEALLDAGIGLWDTVAAATREGSLDQAIRLREASDLQGLADTLPDLRAVGFNGGKSAAIGRRQLAARSDLTLIDLPSSSPAFTLAFEAKLERWMALKPYVG
jgi:double-stranded uracil-DNA glycosylase